MEAANEIVPEDTAVAANQGSKGWRVEAAPTTFASKGPGSWQLDGEHTPWLHVPLMQRPLDTKESGNWILDKEQ